MNIQELPQFHPNNSAQLQTINKSKSGSGLRKQLSLPCLSNHIQVKQLYPSKSWNELARETEEKKQKRRLNNQLKNQLEKFFEGDEILMEPSRGSKSRNNRSNKRMSTDRNQSQPKSSVPKKSTQSFSRQNKPVVKLEIKQSNFIPRKGVKPTHFLADLDIEDSSSEAFRSIVPQSPNQPSFIQRSTPKETPRSHIIPSRLNSNKNGESNYRSQFHNNYTQPDSPVDLLQPLRSESSQHYANSQQDMSQKLNYKCSDYILNSLKSAQQALLRSQDDVKWQSSSLPIGYTRSDADRDVAYDRLSHQKNIQLFKQLQKRLGVEKDSPHQLQEYYDLQITNVDYLQRPNLLEIIDEVEDERSFNVQKDSDDGRFRSIPLSVVGEKEESDQDHKLSEIPVRYSAEAGTLNLQDSSLAVNSKRRLSLKPNSQGEEKMIRQCSSKQLLKNDEVRQEQSKPLHQLPSTLTQSFKKKQPSNVLEISHSSHLSKLEEYSMPTLNIFAASIHQKPQRQIPNQVFDMSPIQRSKASAIIHDQNDNSISKEFGNDWFTPKHDKKSQSIERLSPIYDQRNNTDLNQYDKDKPLLTFPSFNPLPLPLISLANPQQNHLSIKYPQPTHQGEKNQQHTLKVIRKNEVNKLIPSSIPNLDLKQFNYGSSIQDSLGLDKPFRKDILLSTEPIAEYPHKKGSIRQIKDDPVKQISRKFSIDFSQLNFPNKVEYSPAGTPSHFTPTKLGQKASTSYIPNAIVSPPLQSPFDAGNKSSNSFSISNSPLNSYRPSGPAPSSTSRNSNSSKKGKGIGLWINNYREVEGRSKSPIHDRLSSINKKKSFERMSNLDGGIFKSRSKSRTSKPVNPSPEKIIYKPSNPIPRTISNPIQDSNNLSSISTVIQNPPSRKQSLASPTKSFVRLGNKVSVTEIQSPKRNSVLQGKQKQEQAGKGRTGIKLSCEFKKHKYQQKGVVKYLN